jgi:hypothetical protein
MVELLEEGSILVILAGAFNIKQVLLNAEESTLLTILSVSQSSSDSLSLVSSITRSKN